MSTPAFITFGCFNGFPFVPTLFSSVKDEMPEPLLGPYDLEQAMRIFWRLKSLDLVLNSSALGEAESENFKTVSKAKDLEPFLKNDLTREDGRTRAFGSVRLTSDSKISCESNEPISRIGSHADHVNLYETYFSLETLYKDRIFAMTSLYIDDISVALNEHNLLYTPCYYFKYFFGSYFVNGPLTGYKPNIDENSSSNIYRGEFTAALLDSKIKVHAEENYFHYFLGLPLNPFSLTMKFDEEFYQDFEFE